LDEKNKKGKRKKKNKKENGKEMDNGIEENEEEKGKFIMNEDNKNVEKINNIELEVKRGKLIGICGSVG
jgi:ABC-type polysaccharide/polyol phosphate transport system ATPase subunit